MPTTEKFLFFRSFDQPEPVTEESVIEEELPDEPEIIVPTFSQEELDAARAEGVEKGREEGIREAAEATERLIGETTQSINTQLESLFERQHKANAEIFKDAVNAGIAVVRKCFPATTMHHGIDEIETMIGEILPQILEEPRIIINVHGDLREPLSERMDEIIKNTHFDGKVVIRAENGIHAGDCRIEWSNGGAERNLDELWEQIDRLVEENLSAAAENMTFDSIPGQPPVLSPAESDPIPDESEANIESITENTEQTPEAPKDRTEHTLPDTETRTVTEVDDTPQGPPPTPFAEDREQPENTQNTVPFEPSGSSPENPEEASTMINGDTDTDDKPSSSDNDAIEGMEPTAEVGILTDTPDATASGLPESTT